MTAKAPARPPSAPQRPIPLRGRLRIAARLVVMFALLLACILLYYLRRLRGPHNPWPSRFLHGIAHLSGVRLTVTGERRHKGTILLANHVSWIDIPAIAGHGQADA